MQEATLRKIETITRAVIEALEITPTSVKAEWQEGQERIYVTVDAGEANGFLIGKEGRMLEALKEIIEAAASRSANSRVDIYFDVGSYWAKIEAGALESAKQAAEDVRRTGRAVRLEPMHPLLRRYLHRALQNDPEVATASEGEGTWRQMSIVPKGAGPGNF
ncbi:MAG: R3H domain-containing nucleic acid-binding protein [Elusimicrobiota bacterium]